MNVNYPIIDADGHVMERDAELREFLEGRYAQGPHFQTYSYFPSLDGWNRGFGVPGKVHETPAAKWVEFLDELGVHTSVLYPTGGLALGLIQNSEWACVIARAYNSWLAERFSKRSPRLKGVALLPVHEPFEAAKELERAKGLGLVAGLAFSNAILGATHAMTHQVDGLIDQHHGETNASILPHVMEFNLPACPERFRDIAVAIGEEVAGLDAMTAATRSIEAVKRLISDIGLAKGLGDIGLREEDIPLLSANAVKDACLVTNPRSATVAEIEEIFRKAL